MSETDKFIHEELTPFYKRTFEAFKQNHQALYSIINSFLTGKQNHVGVRITENEKLLETDPNFV